MRAEKTIGSQSSLISFRGSFMANGPIIATSRTDLLGVMFSNEGVAGYLGLDLFDDRTHQASGWYNFDALPAHADQEFPGFRVDESH